MGCLYCDFDGKCQFFEDKDNKPQGCNDDGVCLVDDDPDPSYGCESYESNWVCHECGADLNIDDCTCEDG